VGVLLSGGLDSSAIAVVAQKLTDKEIESFSVVSEYSQSSEGRFIDTLCHRTAIKNQKLLFRIPDVRELLERVSTTVMSRLARSAPLQTFDFLSPSNRKIESRCC